MKNKINAYYDKSLFRPVIANHYGDFGNFGYWYPSTRGQQEACENLMEELLAFLPERSGTILDVACGLGATTRYLLKYYEPANVTGINISEKQLACCRDNAPGCTFLLMDAARLEFPDNHFDTVLCVEAAFHFNTRETFLREAYRVLKPGGRLLVADITQYKPIVAWSKLFPSENHVPNLPAYRALYQRAGFSDVVVVDATKECVNRRYRGWLGIAYRAWRERKISLGHYVMGVVAIHIGRGLIRRFFLAAATKA